MSGYALLVMGGVLVATVVIYATALTLYVREIRKAVLRRKRNTVNVEQEDE